MGFRVISGRNGHSPWPDQKKGIKNSGSFY